MALSNENNPMLLAIPLGSVTTDAAVLPAGIIPRKARIVGAWLQNAAAVAASDTNFALLTLRAGATTVATHDSRAAGQGALVANVASPMAVVSAAAVVDTGVSLSALYNETGTVGYTNALLVIAYFPL